VLNERVLGWNRASGDHGDYHGDEVPQSGRPEISAETFPEQGLTPMGQCFQIEEIRQTPHWASA
jgi:hypothetical protein